MNIDVGKAITELLFEHDTVILPGLGGFTSTPESATVDYVQGVVTPPTKKIEFNPNLVINDGILIDHIQKREVVTSQQAKESVEHYVDDLKAALERREIIEIPDIGRIYRDYEQQLKFMPEGTNFEAQAFGLPQVKFTPVTRVKEAPDTAEAAPPKIGKVAAATQVAAAAHEKSAVKAKKAASTSEWLNKMLPFLIILAAILLAFSLFMILRDGRSDAVAKVEEDRVNVKPAPTGEAEVDDKTAQLPDENESPESSEDTGKSTSSSAPQNDETASSPPPPPAKTTAPPAESAGGFIVIHSFGVQANAKKFERKLKRDGYDTRSTKQGGLHRVGVRARDLTSSEIDALIDRLGKKYGSTPKLVDY